MITESNSKPRRCSVQSAVVPADFSLARWEGTAFPPRFFRLNKILVPVDFSDCSKAAIRYAAQFAHREGGRILLMHVVAPRPRRDRRRKTGSKGFSRLDDAERRLLELGQDELGKASGWDLLVQTGKPNCEIVKTAKALGVDLIVMVLR